MTGQIELHLREPEESMYIVIRLPTNESDPGTIIKPPTGSGVLATSSLTEAYQIRDQVTEQYPTHAFVVAQIIKPTDELLMEFSHD